LVIYLNPFSCYPPTKWNSKEKIEAKLSLCMPRRHGRREEVQLHQFLTSALDGG